MTLSIEEFRQKSEKVAALTRALADPIMVEALEILEKSGPHHSDVKPDISPTYAETRLGHILGYNQYPTTLKLMTEPLLVPEQIREDYAHRDEDE